MRGLFLSALSIMFAQVTPRRIGRICFVASLIFLLFTADLLAKPIKLRSGHIDPRRQPAQAQGRRQAEDGLYLVQLRDNLPVGWRAQVRQMGVQLLRYVPDDTFVARMPGASVAQVRALPFVEFVGEYLPEHKVHPRLAAMLTQPGLQSHNVSILLSRTATAAELNAGRAAFLSLRQQNTLPFGSILRGHISHTKLAELARSHAVIWIEPAPNFKLVDETAAKIVAGDGGPGQTFVQSLGFDGRGVTVAVPDSGLHNGDAASMHPDLFGRVTAFFHYGTLSDAADEHSHGTHVAGIIAGNGATGECGVFG